MACFADIAIMYGLKAGAEIDQSLQQTIITEDERILAYSSAVSILGKRQHSRYEVTLKLKKREFSQDAINYALNKLDDACLLNDLEFAKNYARELSSRCAKKVIYGKLLAKGIDSHTAHLAVNECDEHTALIKSVNAANSRYANLSENERKFKVMRSLAGKGFDYDAIKRAVNNNDEE